MFSKSKNNSTLAELSRFAGKHLALVGKGLLDVGFSSPSGMTEVRSWIGGATNEFTRLENDDPGLAEAVAQHWFSVDHKNARFVSVTVNGALTIDGVRSECLILTARTGDFSTRILAYLPYTPQTSDSPIRLASPLVDLPSESGSFASDADMASANVLSGMKAVSSQLKFDFGV